MIAVNKIVLKIYIIFFFIVLLINYLLLNQYIFSYLNNTIPLFKILRKQNNKTIHINKKYPIKYNDYNIEMDKNEDFYRTNYFYLMPGKNCPNKKIKTIFFKPKYPTFPYKYITFQEKNISLKSKEEIQPTAFTQTKNEIREFFLKKLGFFMDTKMNSYNLYIAPYNINYTLEKGINHYFVDKYQKINRFFNYQEYVSKSLLYNNYKELENIFPLDYNFMLETYSYPEQKEAIEKKFKGYYLKSEKDIWMIKPKLGSLGNKVTILKNFSNINLKNYIITKYLYKPFLIKGFKNDFRFHGLVSSIKPLKLYLYNEGFVRLASEKYNISLSDLNNKFAILTNIHINIKNKKKYKYPINISNLEDSNLWNFETFGKYCEKNNINYTKIFIEISDIFIKTMISVREKIVKYIENNKYDSSNFFHLIGFDIIFDQNLKPYLLEMNRRCSFRNNNEAEKFYAFNIIADTLNIVGIRTINKNNEYKNKNDLLKENLEESLCELDRPRGGYKLIFPLKNNFKKYKKFFGKNISKEDQLLWKNLIE